MKISDYPELFLDSNYLAHQARFCLNGLGYKNIATGVIFGFLSRVLSLAQKFQTNDISFFWDSKKSLRKRRHSFYKEKRHKDLSEEEDKELKEAFKQFAILRTEILPMIGFNNNFMMTGFEADDIIAKAVINSINIPIVVTADEDLFQLLDYCMVYNPTKDEMMTKQILEMERNASPSDWIRMKQIAGCSSDNVPGVKGVGEKTALSYIHGALKEGKKKKDIELSQDIIARNEWLVRLPLPGTPPIPFRADQLSLDMFQEVCGEYGLASFLEDDKWQEWENFFKGEFTNQEQKTRRRKSVKEIIMERRRTRQ